MKTRTIQIALPLACMLYTGYSAGTASDYRTNSDYPIAGATPWQRPEGAPVLEWVRHDQEWFKRSLTGVKRPYPRSIYFLDNQGDWYTPFTRQGMLPPYDLRGWHQ